MRAKSSCELRDSDDQTDLTARVLQMAGDGARKRREFLARWAFTRTVPGPRWQPAGLTSELPESSRPTVLSRRRTPRLTALEATTDASVNHPLVHFTYLAFQLNGRLDAGHHLDPDMVRRHIRDHTILDWLPDAIEGAHRIDLSLFTHDEARDAMLDFLERVENAVDAQRKFGVKNNGIALLAAYCLEGAQQASGATGAAAEWP